MPRPRKPETQALGLRLPVTLAERVRVAADANGRTWNAQVVHLIEAGFDVDAKARTTTSEKWGDALARSAATAAADAARDAVLRVAREFDDALTQAKDREAKAARLRDAYARALESVSADYDEEYAAQYDSFMAGHSNDMAVCREERELREERARADRKAQRAERRAEADRRAASADPDPDPPLPPGVLPVDVYPTDNGVKLGTRTKQRRSPPKPL